MFKEQEMISAAAKATGVFCGSTPSQMKANPAADAHSVYLCTH